MRVIGNAVSCCFSFQLAVPACRPPARCRLSRRRTSILHDLVSVAVLLGADARVRMGREAAVVRVGMGACACASGRGGQAVVEGADGLGHGGWEWMRG